MANATNVTLAFEFPAPYRTDLLMAVMIGGGFVLILVSAMVIVCWTKKTREKIYASVSWIYASVKGIDAPRPNVEETVTEDGGYIYDDVAQLPGSGVQHSETSSVPNQGINHPVFDETSENKHSEAYSNTENMVQNTESSTPPTWDDRDDQQEYLYENTAFSTS